ncbi:hypothetical protein PACILC2_28020 [Paenibacillus cisolokensis]|uniref:Uncharacterized protein n=1 Tax=Paenibacillus cisolokensis TaxID=1658519 RepID=A0ABQ4N8E9_9BACL|nr:hypothetical protein PACILC2_28020 [Paenibacillus cisolokensis]
MGQIPEACRLRDFRHFAVGRAKQLLRALDADKLNEFGKLEARRPLEETAQVGRAEIVGGGQRAELKRLRIMPENMVDDRLQPSVRLFAAFGVPGAVSHHPAGRKQQPAQHRMQHGVPVRPGAVVFVDHAQQ